jgi:murein DD-endopeptidase MepM/ murein hydrolase activator NlpD
MVTLDRFTPPADGTDPGSPAPPYEITLSAPVPAALSVDASTILSLGFTPNELTPDFEEGTGALTVMDASVDASNRLKVNVAPMSASASFHYGVAAAASSTTGGQVSFDFGVGTLTRNSTVPIPSSDWADNTAESFRLPIGDNGAMDNGANLAYLVRSGEQATFTQPVMTAGDKNPRDWAIKYGGTFLADGTTGYLAHKIHYGVDWNLGSGSTDLGMPIHAVANGVVLYDKVISTGARVIGLLHTLPDGSHVVSDYEHAQYSNAAVYTNYPEVATRWSKGDVVRKGEILGFIGNTGMGKGGAVHLHFSLIKEDPGNLDGLFVRPIVDAAGTTTDYGMVRVTGGKTQNTWSYPFKDTFRQAILNSFWSPLDFIAPGNDHDVRVVGILSNTVNPDYFFGTNTNAATQYADFLTASTSPHFKTKILNIEGITPAWPEIWKKIDVLLLADNGIPTDQLATFLDGFNQARGSKGLVSVDSSVCVLGMTGLMGWSKPGIGSGDYWDYNSNTSDLAFNADPGMPVTFPTGPQACVYHDARLFQASLPSDFHVLAQAADDPTMVYAGYRDLNADDLTKARGRLLFLGPFDASFFPAASVAGSYRWFEGNLGGQRAPRFTSTVFATKALAADAAATETEALQGILFRSLR